MNLSDPEKQIFIALASIEGVGEKTLQNILSWCEKSGESLEKCWQRGSWPETIFFSRSTYQRYCDVVGQASFVKNVSERLRELQITSVVKGEAEYPKLLKEVVGAPSILYCRGELSQLSCSVPISVVGARHMSAYGKRATQVIAAELIKVGATVVSGFMYGVDVTAHLAALDAGGGSIGVLGFGLDQMYPNSQRELFYHLLSRKMLFITQFPPGTQARAGNFLQRNQVVAGLSWAVVVTEAGFPSGSFSTAQAALDEGRLVCAVPGPFDSQYSQGTKWLINEGATLVTSGSQVLTELGFPVYVESERTSGSGSEKNLSVVVAGLSEKEKLVFEAVIKQTGEMESIIKQTNFTAPELAALLTELELKGLLVTVGDTWQIAL